MAETRRLKTLVDAAIRRLELPDGDLVVALSGGADSAALALLCLESGRHVRALHVNHGLEHSEMMEDAARQVAENLDVDLEVREVSVAKGSSPEGLARSVRYRAFDEATSSGEALLTAHTIEDNAETVVINLIRGTGSRGLAGIPYRRPERIYRPALDLSSSETREIAALADLGFADDPMNEDPAITRNWVRRVILPQLRQMNPQIAMSLRRTSRHVAAETDYIEDLARSLGPGLGDGVARISRGVLMTAPGPVADRTVMTMLAHVIGREHVTSDLIGRVWEVVTGEATSHQLVGGVVVRNAGAMVVIATDSEPAANESFVLTPGHHRAQHIEFEVRSASGVCRVLPLDKWSAVFPHRTELRVQSDGSVTADDELAWIPGKQRLPVAWYQPGGVGYLLVRAREGTRWTSSL